MYTAKSRSYNFRQLIAFFIVIAIALLVIAGWRAIGNARNRAGQTGATQLAHSLDDPNSPWVIVNKKRPLRPANYAPHDLVVPAVPLRLDADNEEMLLRRDASQALETMVKEAKGQGVPLMLASAYRSYAFQKKLYDYYVSQQGRTEADTQSARPGYSEHQTGLAADLEPTSRECEILACFANTAAGKWLAAHAYEYGFVIRYAAGQEGTTGYIYEPWHIRYLGKDAARQVHDSNARTLEDYFGLVKANKY